MLADAREGLALSLEWGGLKSRLEFTLEVGFLHLWRHELDEAEEKLQAALKTAETAGIMQIQTLSLTYLTVLYRFRRQVDEVIHYAQRAQMAADAAKMPDYVAAAKGNQAWLAWCHQDLATAEQRGQEALEIWHQSPLVYPFQWQALWPLTGVALKHDDQEKTGSYVRALLDLTQQLLPGPLNEALEAASHAGNTLHLRRAAQIAQEMGYL
jgi:hypothetical protein